jgi:hypothetical protein
MAVVVAEGTTLGYAALQAGPFTLIAHLVSVQPPGSEVPEVESGDLSSTFKEKRPGRIPDLGEVAYRIRFDPNNAGHKLFRADADTPGGADRWWQIIYNDTFTTKARTTFKGWVKSFKPDNLEDESNLEADVVIVLTSKPVHADGV